MPLDIISYSKLKTKADLVGGKIPSTQLPSYVDDILEYADIQSFPTIGEGGKIYVDLDTNRCYRWSGTQYTEVSPSLALGETSATAYRGDKGKIAYDHSQLVIGNPHNVTAGEISYDNAESGLIATNMQNVMDELAEIAALPTYQYLDEEESIDTSLIDGAIILNEIVLSPTEEKTTLFELPLSGGYIRGHSDNIGQYDNINIEVRKLSDNSLFRDSIIIPNGEPYNSYYINYYSKLVINIFDWEGNGIYIDGIGGGNLNSDLQNNDPSYPAADYKFIFTGVKIIENETNTKKIGVKITDSEQITDLLIDKALKDQDGNVIDETYLKIENFPELSAENISYDNAENDLVSTDVQNAIDELAENLSLLEQDDVILYSKVYSDIVDAVFTTTDNPLRYGVIEVTLLADTPAAIFNNRYETTTTFYADRPINFNFNIIKTSGDEETLTSLTTILYEYTGTLDEHLLLPEYYTEIARSHITTENFNSDYIYHTSLILASDTTLAKFAIVVEAEASADSNYDITISDLKHSYLKINETGLIPYSDNIIVNSQFTEKTLTDVVSKIYDKITDIDDGLSVLDQIIEGEIDFETDPVFTAWDKSSGISITESQISDFGAYSTTDHNHDTIYEPADAAIQSHITVESGNPHNVTAGEISYDNTSTEMSATTVQAAIDEIEISVLECAKVYSYSGLNLSGASWLDTAGDFPYYQTISVPGIVNGDEPFADIVTTSLTKQQIIDMQNAWASIYEIETGTDEITFRSLEPITVDISLKVKVIK